MVMRNAALNAYYWLTRPYVEWRWRRDRSVVCITDWCLRMTCEDSPFYCRKHCG